MEMKEKILESAQGLIQTRGVNGFSFADIAKEVGVSKPSLYHHFSSKAELVCRLMENYTEQLKAYLASVNREKPSACEKLQAYCDLYRFSLDQDRVCLGGMLSAEALTLAPETQPLLARFFEAQQQWLIQVLEEGEASGELSLATAAEKQASTIVAMLQGALLVSRAAQTKAFFEQSVEGLLSAF